MMHPNKPTKYIIKYSAVNKIGQTIKEGKVKTKEVFGSDFAAKASLDNYFRKTLTGFDKLIVLSCEPDDVMLSIANDLSDFLNILKTK